MIRALWEGKTLSREGHFPTKDAVIHSLPEDRRPPIFRLGLGPQAAAVAGRQGDGLWTLADPEAVPEIIEAYRGAADDAGREPGEIILQAAFSGRPMTTGRSKGPESGRARSRRSSIGRTGTTPRRCTSTGRRKSSITTSARR